MNTMMLALLQGRLRDAASNLQQRLHALKVEPDEATGDRTGDAVTRELLEVSQALDALQAGRYGSCHGCEQPMEPDELLRTPYRLRCRDCEGESPAARAAQRVLAPTWRCSQLMSSPAGIAPDTRATS